MKGSEIKNTDNIKDEEDEISKHLSVDLEEALKEVIIIENEIKSGKRVGYNNVNEMLEAILKD